MFSKNLLLLISIFLIISLGSGAANVLAAPDSPSGAGLGHPHNPDLRPSQPHLGKARPVTGQVLSLNWAGYAVSAPAGSVSDVKGSWRVPSLSCTGGPGPAKTSYAAFWVGIDGFNSNTVEQTGVLGECYHGRAYYFTWYEFYPAYPVYVTSTVPVKPGDVVYGEVSYSSSTGFFTVTLTDTTTGKTFSTSQTDSSAQRSSAEWITEAPSSGGQILPLANFGTAYYGYDYTGIASTGYATVNGVTGAIGSFGSGVYQLIMVTMNLTVKAQPSALTSDQTSFTVNWERS